MPDAGMTSRDKGKSIMSYRHEVGSERKYQVSENYMGKNPITRTQWRRFQRLKQVEKQGAVTGPRDVVPFGVNRVPVVVKKEYRVKKNSAEKELANQPTARISKEATNDFQFDSG